MPKVHYLALIHTYEVMYILCGRSLQSCWHAHVPSQVTCQQCLSILARRPSCVHA